MKGVIFAGGQRVPDSERFSILTVEEDLVQQIDEKPKKPSKRGELEIADLNQLYAHDKQLRWSMLECFWRDAGTFTILFEINQY